MKQEAIVEMLKNSPIRVFVHQGNRVVVPKWYPYAGNRSIALDFGNFILYYSYGTVIGFRRSGWKPIVRENEWGPTTERHMKAIEGDKHADRVEAEEFEQELAQLLIENLAGY